MWKNLCAPRGSGQRASAPVLGSVGLGVVVGVGGLHDLEVAPVGPGQVGELDQVGLVVDHVVTVGRAAQHVVDDGGHLGAGNPVVGTEVPVGVAADPAVAGRLGHVGVEPVAAGHVAEVAHGVLGLIGEGQGDDAELGPGDGVVGPVVAVLVAGDHAQRGQGVHGGGVPRVGGHVGEGLGNGHVLVVQQSVEHLGHFRPGHVVVRSEGAAGIAGEVGDVVGGVQPAGHAGDAGVGHGHGAGGGELRLVHAGVNDALLAVDDVGVAVGGLDDDFIPGALGQVADDDLVAAGQGNFIAAADGAGVVAVVVEVVLQVVPVLVGEDDGEGELVVAAVHVKLDGQVAGGVAVAVAAGAAAGVGVHRPGGVLLIDQDEGGEGGSAEGNNIPIDIDILNFIDIAEVAAQVADIKLTVHSVEVHYMDAVRVRVGGHGPVDGNGMVFIILIQRHVGVAVASVY